ncbi:hypothetical protein MPSEU_000263200 [Mayamaea pseudoterrestris]|nr:hypothetical protein MPSEU_000263200 [Mayamaea pseudoterrestris]
MLTDKTPPRLQVRDAHSRYCSIQKESSLEQFNYFFTLVRACRNAIEFNQLPALGEIVPGGRDEMKLDVLLAVPAKYQEDLDLNAVRAVFPYGKVNIQIQDGGMVANHGKMIEKMGDKNEDMVVVCVAVSVGY